MEQKDVNKFINALYMILAGFILLLIAFGIFRWSIIFQLLRLWPLFFVIAGIQEIFYKAHVSFLKIISPIIMIISFGWVIYVYQGGDIFHIRKVELFKISQEIVSPEKTTDFNIDFSYGKLKIANEIAGLIKGDVSTPIGFKPTINFKKFEEEDLYQISSNPTNKYSFGLWDSDHFWMLGIGEKAPAKIKIKTYAGNNEIDMSSLSVTDFMLNTTFGSDKVIFGNKTRKASIESFGSAISIMIPKEMGLKISMEKLFIVDNFEELEMDRGFKKYISPNYENVENKIDLNLNLKLSKLEIRFY